MAKQDVDKQKHGIQEMVTSQENGEGKSQNDICALPPYPTPPHPTTSRDGGAQSCKMVQEDGELREGDVLKTYTLTCTHTTLHNTARHHDWFENLTICLGERCLKGNRGSLL